MRSTIAFILAAAVLGSAAPALAQGRRDARDRLEVARAQGVPPGQMPPPNECRVWYDDRPNGRQPSPMNCRQAEAIAARDPLARVIYGENVFWGEDVYWRGRGPDRDRAMRRDGRVRDPRITGGILADSRSTVAFRNGYRDGLTKGRDDGEDGDRYDISRHDWYRSADRGYDDDFGPKPVYKDNYRDGFRAGYDEGYRVYARR